jgi:hypothetical protein
LNARKSRDPRLFSWLGQKLASAFRIATTLRDSLPAPSFKPNSIYGSFVAHFLSAWATFLRTFSASENLSNHDLVMEQVRATMSRAKTFAAILTFYPAGVALDAAGNLYVSDATNNDIVKVPAVQQRPSQPYSHSDSRRSIPGLSPSYLAAAAQCRSFCLHPMRWDRFF